FAIELDVHKARISVDPAGHISRLGKARNLIPNDLGQMNKRAQRLQILPVRVAQKKHRASVADDRFRHFWMAFQQGAIMLEDTGYLGVVLSEPLVKIDHNLLTVRNLKK